MPHIYHSWTRLGLGALMGTTALAGCGQSASTPTPAAEPAAVEAPAVAAETLAADPMPVGSVGGEGEGGVAIEQAATDPVVFNIALAVTEAHILAARDAYADGETEAAAEMFAHPVSEVLFDMEPVLEARGVTLFDGLLTDASMAASAGETPEQISARTDAIIAALRAAALKAPENGTAPADIKMHVIADMIERAVAMYRSAAASGVYEPYLDGYGFHKVAETQFAAARDEIAASNPEAAASIGNAIAALAEAYPSAAPQDALMADISQLTVLASDVTLSVN
ncbi:hypothetical protein [Hyphomonas oceanitis]|uniref:Putative lipoprotein n=1 Tax=Hyphomonas oceanitis SCH89 TaxID=1280953 RepID=A0A059G949_9PROT|nr:hypothetical protein [Hyphomonas oceanitis]KDA03110.1 putative lipoprotein [Hyphomonas oceanitis SCH89]